MAAVLQLTDGDLNATLSIAAQALDTIMLLTLRPFNDGEVTLTEALSGLSTLAAYLCLGLPIFLGEVAYVGDVTALVLCSLGVAVSAAAAAMHNVQELLSKSLQCLQGLASAVSGAEVADLVPEGVEDECEAAAEVCLSCICRESEMGCLTLYSEMHRFASTHMCKCTNHTHTDRANVTGPSNSLRSGPEGKQ